MALPTVQKRLGREPSHRVQLHSHGHMGESCDRSLVDEANPSWRGSVILLSGCRSDTAVPRKQVDSIRQIWKI